MDSVINNHQKLIVLLVLKKQIVVELIIILLSVGKAKIKNVIHHTLLDGVINNLLKIIV